MIPSKHQYKKWTLPTKCSYWAAIIGIPLAIISLALALAPYLNSDHSRLERNHLLFQVAQDLRFNREWLSNLAREFQKKSASLPLGSLKTDRLISLMGQDYQLVTAHSLGEEKYIYQDALKLKDLGHVLGSPKILRDIQSFNHKSNYHLHDVLFLNNFLFWYLSPLIEIELDEKQLNSLGWGGLPGNEFIIYDLKELDMKYFVDDGKPITEFTHYLGLID